MDIHTGLHPTAETAASGIWQIAYMPSVYHIPGKFDGKTGTLSAMQNAIIAIEAGKVNNGGSLVDRNFLSRRQMPFGEKLVLSETCETCEEFDYEGFIG